MSHTPDCLVREWTLGALRELEHRKILALDGGLFDPRVHFFTHVEQACRVRQCPTQRQRRTKVQSLPYGSLQLSGEIRESFLQVCVYAHTPLHGVYMRHCWFNENKIANFPNCSGIWHISELRTWFTHLTRCKFPPYSLPATQQQEMVCLCGCPRR